MMPPRARRKPHPSLVLRKDAGGLACRIMTPCRNILLHQTQQIQQRTPMRIKTDVSQQDKGKPLSLNELKRLSVSSMGVQDHPSRWEQRQPRRTGFKYNRNKIAHPIQQKQTLARESLYDKSLRKAHSALRRKDLEQSLNHIVVNQCLTSKRSLLNQEADRRLKTEVCQPQTATIIIELKRLFRTRGEYSFVQNNYDAGKEEKPDEQIFSTAHSYPDRPISNTSQTSSLHKRTRTAPHPVPSPATAAFKRQPHRGKPCKENELVPWLKDTQRALSELQFQPFLPL